MVVELNYYFKKAIDEKQLIEILSAYFDYKISSSSYLDSEADIHVIYNEHNGDVKTGICIVYHDNLKIGKSEEEIAKELAQIFHESIIYYNPREDDTKEFIMVTEQGRLYALNIQSEDEYGEVLVENKIIDKIEIK